MKLKTVMICLIVMLLFCSNSYCQSNNTLEPSTGDKIKTTLTIDEIRTINDKLIERKYLLEENAVQDSIINNQKQMLIEYKTITSDLQNRIEEANKINEKLRKQYNKQRNKTIIASSVAGSIGVGFITTLLISIFK